LRAHLQRAPDRRRRDPHVRRTRRAAGPVGRIRSICSRVRSNSHRASTPRACTTRSC
jgi:hypothetical protein